MKIARGIVKQASEFGMRRVQMQSTDLIPGKGQLQGCLPMRGRDDRLQRSLGIREGLKR